MRTFVLALCLSCLLAGCAIGRVREDEIAGLAIGHAKLERTAEGEARIQGGALSSNLSELLGAALAGAVLYFTGGAL